MAVTSTVPVLPNFLMCQCRDPGDLATVVSSETERSSVATARRTAFAKEAGSNGSPGTSTSNSTIGTPLQRVRTASDRKRSQESPRFPRLTRAARIGFYCGTMKHCNDSQDASRRVREAVDDVYRAESRRVLATLIRLVGDFDLAEDAMQEAFAAALQQWPRDGVPANPRAWLVSAGRFKAIDTIRKRARFNDALPDIAERLDAEAVAASNWDDNAVEDDRLRLIFTCCHPALSSEAQVALTLREVCGLTTEEIAHAFLTSHTTLAQRIVRAKSKIRDAKIPYVVPERTDLPDRLKNVLHVTYLVFNEGYFASSGTALTRHDLSSEAIRLGRLIAELQPDPEANGLLALMLLHESRRPARTTSSGDVILLDDQDRSLWNQAMITEGTSLVQRSLADGGFGIYTLQAAIAAVHAEAAAPSATDWGRIVRIYDLLSTADRSPVVELNRAVAVAMRDGPAAGLALIEGIISRGDLTDYSLLHSAHADLCRRLGRSMEARASYQRARDLASQEPERRFLDLRLRELAI